MPVCYLPTRFSCLARERNLILMPDLKTTDSTGLKSLAAGLESLQLPPLPVLRPLLLIGHGTRDAEGRQGLLDFAATYSACDPSRPVVPCFLELTGPTIQEGVD